MLTRERLLVETASAQVCFGFRPDPALPARLTSGQDIHVHIYINIIYIRIIHVYIYIHISVSLSLSLSLSQSQFTCRYPWDDPCSNS